MSEDYRDVNRAYWDDRAPAHAASSGYAVSAFGDDPAFLSEVVRFDLPRLGDVSGLDGVHLQCHIGTDTVSLARLGARMTGLDLSPASLEEARRVNEVAGTDVRFVQAEVYDAASVLGEGAFDLVFTGVGALCWLPDVRRWAEVVSALLRPGGRLFLREGHPVLWALDEERDDGLLVLDFPYFSTPEPLAWDEDGSYVEVDRPFTHNRSLSWNHGLGEVVTAVLDAGLELTMLVEHDTVPWEGLPGSMVLDAPTGETLKPRTGGGKEWRLKERPERAPLSYTLQAVKR